MGVCACILCDLSLVILKASNSLIVKVQLINLRSALLRLTCSCTVNFAAMLAS